MVKVGDEGDKGTGEPGGGISVNSGAGEVERSQLSVEEEGWHSPCGEGGSPAQAGRRSLSSSSSSVSACCSDVDLEAGGGGREIKVSAAKVEKDCRICHMGLESSSNESGVAIELGCSCKDDLAAAHKQCAETWFKIKGNKTCEICGSTASNVAGTTETVVEVVEQLDEAANVALPTTPETRSFWRGHRFLNFLLSCMVFAFVISWLFHFNVPS